jgi:hypothetical protein
VGGKPTVAADAGGAAANEMDSWDCGGTPSGTLEEHCWMELSQPSSSLLPCGLGLHFL